MAATVAVLEDQGFATPCRFAMQFEGVPGYGSEESEFEIVSEGVPGNNTRKVRRTYEAHRLVEFAAIAVAGLALFHAGGHQIRDIALRGASADYLVDDEGSLLEIAGRSRRSDFQWAWDVRWQRLSDRLDAGFYVCVCEFETPAGRLAFAT
ncbi:MAG: hypothetical protein H8E44_23155 [Planctomycetes bacterium]|nr:hypothetical protein [Planctomycetota bacterium]MBL7037280.1 hypothetical protein [Pirellulaceae bacterium]